MNNAEIPFLRQAPVINMVPLQEATVFIGEIVVERPDFHDMLNMHQFMMNPEQKVMKMIQKAMQRKGSSVEWIGFVADLEGVIAIIEFKKPMILGAAKTIVGALLKCLDTDHRNKVTNTLRVIDEVDYKRILEWKTPEGLRPEEEESDDESVEEAVITFVKRPSDAPAPTMTGAECSLFMRTGSTVAPTMATFSEWSDEYDNRLALRTAAQAARPTRLVLNMGVKHTSRTLMATYPLNPSDFWSYRVQQGVTLLLFATGGFPVLGYVRCRLETRRTLLLQKAVKAKYNNFTLVKVMKVAVLLAEEGAFPGPFDAEGRTRSSEFLTRCQNALEIMDPSAETDPMKLSDEAAQNIHEILHGLEVVEIPPPYHGCYFPDCIDKEPSWEVNVLRIPDGVETITISVCTRCRYPKSFGRTIKHRSDMMNHQLERLRVEQWLAHGVR